METLVLKVIIGILVMFLCTWINAASLDMKNNDNDGSITTERTAVATTPRPFRLSRAYRRGHDVDGHDDHDDDHDHSEENDEMQDSKSIAKSEYWGGYYDFLINEGSYKFWAVFQLATAALLIYSGFAALYYAKVNPSITDDYDDYFLRRRRRRRDTTTPLFFGMDIATFQRIMDALEMRNNDLM
uniref:Rex protein n=1 Tax=Fopius arisanus TaxID=64838 RepID=A0A0C9RJE1_9HYME